MSVVREKIFTKLSSGQIWTDTYWRMPVFIHSCFWKNESLKLRHTHTVFSDYKLQLSINSSVCLQELKQWRHSRVDSYRGKIIVMAKVSLQARAKLLLLRAIICLFSSFSTTSCFKIEWMHQRTFKVDVVNNVIPAPNQGCAVCMKKN